jgi:hypothetical protein
VCRLMVRQMLGREGGADMVTGCVWRGEGGMQGWDGRKQEHAG